MTYCKIPVEHMAIIEGALTDLFNRRREEFAHRHPMLSGNDEASLVHLDAIQDARSAVILARLNPTNGA